MVKSNDKVQSFQIFIAIFSTIIGVTILQAPRSVFNHAGRDGWMSIIFAGLFIAFIVYCLSFLGKKYQGKTLIEYNEIVYGRFIGSIFNIILFLYYLAAAAMTTRLFAEITKTYLLKETPLEIIMLTLLFVGAYLVSQGINPLIRIMQLFFPFLIITLILIFSLSFKYIEFNEILPIFADGPLPMLKNIPHQVFLFAGYGILAYLTAFMEDPKQALKPSLYAIFSVTVVYVLICIYCLGAAGPVEVTQSLFPVMFLARQIDLPGSFVERFDLIIFAFWILTVFTTLSAYYYLSAFSLSKMTRLTEIKSIVPLILPFIYVVGIYPANYQEVGVVFEYLGFAIITISFYFILTLILSFLRKEGKTIAEDQEQRENNQETL